MRGQKGHVSIFLKNHVSGEMGSLGPFWGKITHVIISESTLRIFIKLKTITKYNERTKVACLKFSKKSCFGGNGQFGPILGQNYARHYLRIHSKDFFQTLQHN